MVYSNDLKMKILKIIKSKKFTNIEIINMFDINKRTFYAIKNDHIFKKNKYFHLKTNKRKTKITKFIKIYQKFYSKICYFQNKF